MPTYQIYRTLPARPTKAVHKKTAASKLKKICAAGLSLFLLTAVISAGLSARANQHAAAEATYRAQQKILLAQTVAKLVADNPLIRISVSAVDINSNQVQSIGEQQPKDAASTAKILTAVYYMKQVENGRYSLSQSVDGKTAKQQLQLMLQQSDDIAWQLLNQRLGHEDLQAYAGSIGLHSYQAELNMMSSADLTKLLEKLAAGSLLRPAHTSLLLSFMQRTNYEDFITPAVPTGYQLYHKVGIDGDHVNDAAIIVSPSGQAFVLSIMTDGQGHYQWPERAYLIQQIAAGAIKAYLQ